ncbi:MAG: TRAP transporter small permease subunit [bacterium]|nr:TRAP transporter small permease subunit [bacterium]
MTPWLTLARRIDAFNRRLGRLAGWLAFAMVLVGAFNAVARFLGRYVGRDLSSNAYIELQWYLFSLVFLLGAPYALRAGAHVRVDVLYGRLSARAKAWIDLLGGALLLVPFCVLGVAFSIPSVRESWAVREISPDPGGLARYPIRTVVPIAFLLLLLQGLSEIIKNAALLRGHDARAIGLEELAAAQVQETAKGREPHGGV